MTNSQRLSAVRTALRKWIADRHPEDHERGQPLSEAMLIRDGYFCGRRFRFPLYHAVWFLEEDEIKILSPDGAVVSRLKSREIDALAQAWEQAADEVQQHTLSIAAHLENSAKPASSEPQDQADESRSSHAAPQHRRAA